LTLFGSTPLGARLERAECSLLADGAASAARRHPETRPFTIPIAGGVATFTAPGSPLNKVAGLGFAGPLDPAELGAVEDAFAERGTPVQVELSSLGDPAVGELLSRRGYVLRGVENVLGLGLSSRVVAAVPADTLVEESPLSELPRWLEIVMTGFASPDTQGVPSHETFPRDLLESVTADLAAAPGFHRFLARRGGVPAGGGSLRLAGGVAQLCGAATLPEHRRRGVQRALLAARLRFAGERGCDVAMVTTQPGSKSQENAQRQGFELLYGRLILVREGPKKA
jgi:GNAT superfamily N-acetyltransferase